MVIERRSNHSRIIDVTSALLLLHKKSVDRRGPVQGASLTVRRTCNIVVAGSTPLC